MEESEAERLAGLARKLLIVAVVAALACLAILALDYRLKKDVVTEADRWRREVRQHGQPVPEQWRQQRPPAQQQPGRNNGSSGQPGPVRRSFDPDGMGAGPPGAQDPDAPRAAPIVAPGTESARPPHRGAIDGA